MSSPHSKPTIEGMATPVAPMGTSRRNSTPAFKPEFRRSVLMHPMLFAAVTVCALLLLIGYAMQMKPLYQAESLIYIEPFNTKVLADGTGGAFDPARYDSSLQQQILTATRVDILKQALETLPQSDWSNYGPTPQIAAQNLQNQLKVARVTTSYQISISLKGPDPAHTAAVLNAVTTAYLQAGRKDALMEADQRSQLLTEERDRIEQELARTRTEQAQLGVTLGVANTSGEGGNPFDTQLDNLRTQLTAARTSHEIAAAQLATISGAGAQHADGLSAAASEAILNDPGLASMKSTINTRRAVLSSQMAGLMPENPLYKQDQDELAELDKTLDTMTIQLRDKAARALQDKLRTDLERTGEIETRINGQLAGQTARATGAAPRLQRASELAADVQRLTTRYAVVDDALRSLALETTGPGAVHLALAATVPTSPEPSRKKLIELAALPLAILAGLFAAVFARKRDTRIYTSVDVDDVLGFAPIAILPARADVSDGVLEEYCLRLAGGVESAYRSGGAQTFLVTTVSASTDLTPLINLLDDKLSQLGISTIVVGAATVMSAHHHETGEHAIYDEHKHGTALTVDGHRNDGIAPAFLGGLKAEHAVILLNAPAILFSAQTEYIARCTDVTILVAESGVTTRSELTQAGLLLQRLNVAGVGAVLEELQLKHADPAFRKAVRELDRRIADAPVRRAARSTTAAPVTEPVAYEYQQPEPIQQAEVPVPQPVAEPILQPSAQPPALHPEPVHPEPVIVQHIQPAPVEVVTEPLPTVLTENFSAITHPAPAPEEVASVVSAAEPVHPPVVTSYEAPAPQEPAPSVVPQAQHDTQNVTAHDTLPGEVDMAAEKSWFQRLFHRDAEPVVSILPDFSDEDDEEDEAAEQSAPAMHVQPAARAREQEYDLPLRPAARQPVAAPEPVAAPVAAAAPPPVELQHPEPVAEWAAPTTTVRATPAPVYVEPVQATITPEPAPVHVAEPVVIPPAVAHTAPVELAAPPPPVALAPALAAAAPAAPVATPEAARRPVRPLSFMELTQMRTPTADRASAERTPEPTQPAVETQQPQAHEPAPLAFESPEVTPAIEEPAREVMAQPIPEPEPAELATPVLHTEPVAEIADSTPEPTPAEPVHEVHQQTIAPFEAQAEAEAEPTPAEISAPAEYPTQSFAEEHEPVSESALEEWVPTPLNRWDPIPPLRAPQEPWRNRRAEAEAAPASSQDARRNWPGEDPVRIPPTDHWGSPETMPPAEPVVESSDIVLTRRWGLLSRFQQSEKFRSGQRAAATSDEAQPAASAHPYSSRD